MREDSDTPELYCLELDAHARLAESPASGAAGEGASHIGGPLGHLPNRNHPRRVKLIQHDRGNVARNEIRRVKTRAKLLEHLICGTRLR